MINQYEITLIFAAVITGVFSAAYFYLSTDVFANLALLKRPLKLISSGMMIISIGVLLSAFISYEATLGMAWTFYDLPMSVYFYVLYIIGSLMVALGASQFTHRPNGRVI